MQVIRSSTGECHLDSLISSLSLLGGNGYRRATCVSITIEALIRLGLNRCSFTCIRHMAELLLLVQHSVVVLSDLSLIVSNISPIHLTGAFVHLRLVEALHMLLLWLDRMTEDLGVIQVTVMEFTSESTVGAFTSVCSHALSYHGIGSLKSDVIL